MVVGGGVIFFVGGIFLWGGYFWLGEGVDGLKEGSECYAIKQFEIHLQMTQKNTFKYEGKNSLWGGE